jgi:hypothetical protein
LTYFFPLDGEPPANELLATTPTLAWDAEIPRGTEVEFASLTSGGKLRDMTGRVFVTIGRATPVGMTDFNGAPRWGYFSYRANPEARFRVQLHVSQPMFQKLLGLASNNSVPTLDLSVNDSAGIEIAPPEGYLAAWDNVEVPDLEIKWCAFIAAFPSSNQDGSDEADSA